MKKATFIPFVLSLIILAAAAGCQQESNTLLDGMLSLAETKPDSVIRTLQGEDVKCMNDEEHAKYALAYSWAQDKKRYKVDNDSLIRLAYDYYKTRTNDKWYARCMYYMGKYYWLADSLEQAERCLSQAISKARTMKDYKIEYMAFEKMSRSMALHDTQKAVLCADSALQAFSKADIQDTSNYIYLLQNRGICYMHSMNSAAAKADMLRALSLSQNKKDSVLISVVCQSLSVVYRVSAQNDSSLLYAQQAYDYASKKDESCVQALAASLIRSNKLEEAEILLDSIHPITDIQKYSKLYKQHILAIKKGNIDSAVAKADTAYHFLERMLSKEMDAKSKYYQDILSEEQEKAETENASRTKSFVLIVAVVIIIFLMYIYFSQKKMAAQKLRSEQEKAQIMMKHEQELHKQETDHLNELHEQELSNRDIQITIMREFLIKKVSVSQKIEKLKGNQDCKKLLAEDDWQELEVFLNSVDNMFVHRMKEQFPNLSTKDLQLFMLLRLKVPTKNLTSIYYVSEKAIKQKLYLYKNKVGLEGQKTSLREFIESF